MTAARFLLLLLALFAAGCGSREEAAGEEKTPTYHIGMGKTLYQRGDYAGAVRMFEKAIGMDRECADAYLHLGVIYDDNLKDKKQALACYRMFLSLEPDSMMAERVKEWCGKIEGDLPPATPRPPPSPSPAPTRRSEALRKASPPPLSPGERPTPARRESSLRPSPAPSAAHPAASPSRVSSPSRHTVKAGETLARLAAAYYGDRNAWKAIFEANRDLLKRPDGLRPGMVLVIPAKPGRR